MRLLATPVARTVAGSVTHPFAPLPSGQMLHMVQLLHFSPCETRIADLKNRSLRSPLSVIPSASHLRQAARDSMRHFATRFRCRTVANLIFPRIFRIPSPLLWRFPATECDTVRPNATASDRMRQTATPCDRRPAPPLPTALCLPHFNCQRPAPPDQAGGKI